MTNSDGQGEPETLFTSPGGWISVRRKPGSNFTWSERKHVHSVAIVPIRRSGDSIEVLLHAEINPAHEQLRKINWGVCGGRLDKQYSSLEVARQELREEAGYDCPNEMITDCGRMFASTQSSEHVFLFVADVSDIHQQPMQLEQEELEYDHDNEWMSVAEALKRSEDPRLYVSLWRYIRLKEINDL